MSRLRLLKIAIAAAVVFAVTCGVAVAAEPTDDAPQTDGADLSEQQLLEAASSITKRVAEIRGLPVQSPIPKGVKDRTELREMLVERFHDEVSETEFEAEADVYRRLGLLDEDIDYRELMLDLLTEQIAGFYDQDVGELYIMKGLPEPLLHSTIAHEVFHAIQDQHFDIDRLLAPFTPQEHADFSLARMALIEGDATVLMFDYSLYEEGVLPQNQVRSFIDIPTLAATILELDASEITAATRLAESEAIELGDDAVPSLRDSVLATAPPVVRDALMFPYIEGMRFVIRARSGRSWAEFDRIYDSPPVSTAQILAPQLYFDGRTPLEVRFEAGDALDDYNLEYDTIFGAMKISSWYQTHLRDDAPAPGDIAEAWRGDRLRAYRGPDGDLVVAHLTSWDSPEQAQSHAEKMEQIATDRHGASSSHDGGEYGESWCIRPGDDAVGERIYVERWGQLVLYVEGIPSQLNEAGRETDPSSLRIQRAVWDSLQRIPFDEVLDRRKQNLQSDGD